MTVHGLRHSYATAARRAGVDIEGCQSGWATPTSPSRWTCTATSTRTTTSRRRCGPPRRSLET